MKKLSLCLICSTALFVINCIQSDWWADTEIEIINNSSYNLHITFEEVPPYRGFTGEVYLLKNESGLIYIGSGLGGKDIKPVNPNNGKVNIIFLNIDNGELIKEMENSEDMFKFIRAEAYEACYQFKITDDLLF